MIIAYVNVSAGRERPLAGREPGQVRAAKAMGIQDFVLISGSAPAAGNAVSVAHEAFRAAAAMKLDVAIEALHNSPGSDLLQVQRLKKRKLHLRDRIIQIEDQLTPDIIA
jgi:hypothetical protein